MVKSVPRIYKHLQLDLVLKSLYIYESCDIDIVINPYRIWTYVKYTHLGKMGII